MTSRYRTRMASSLRGVLKVKGKIEAGQADGYTFERDMMLQCRSALQIKATVAHVFNHVFSAAILLLSKMEKCEKAWASRAVESSISKQDLPSAVVQEQNMCLS